MASKEETRRLIEGYEASGMTRREYSLISAVESLGSADGRSTLVQAAKDSFNSLSTSDKTAAVTEVPTGETTIF
jgi:hypothetical protein